MIEVIMTNYEKIKEAEEAAKKAAASAPVKASGL